ncbi:endonuclease MutS2 [Helicobacter burdigaliensis]|uniref:endonuclease MutS2 n=1 Tax=Helicobacter burdigaliensis TaxID=2315334 RepID=UPI000EF6B7DB|nr:endonuclease MutS2 [Helicobacter burdigaliensis]
MINLIKQLDLEQYLSVYESFLARKKDLFLQGDSKIHLNFINELDKIPFNPPPPLKELDKELQLLKKFGYLKLDEIYEFIKIIRYFRYLKGLRFSGALLEWLEAIKIPEALLEILEVFNQEGEIREGKYLELDSLNVGISKVKREIGNHLSSLLSHNKIAPYLVDRQIHLVNDCECLLLKAGFSHVLKGQIMHRSNTGFFYVVPQGVASLKDRLEDLQNKKEEELFRICKEFSSIFNKHLLFLEFINKEFDRFDSYQARLLFAKAKDYEFLAPKENENKIIIRGFKHPALKKPKPIDLDFVGEILMVTGVNAGGKTMLLKSVLSVVFLSKHLMPMPLLANKSSIGNFKGIHLVLEDPQNSKNDISTFGGRMLQFKEILAQKNVIIGVDEIELGTDSDEAASLFKVLLENLLTRQNKIIITTHHKRLAALMANDKRVQLLAALFDEERETPTFSFLDGTIGKSYAFETAVRYGIPRNLVNEARKLYGEDKEKLNELIENSAKLEIKLQEEIKKTEQKKVSLDQKLQNLKDLEEELDKKYKARKNELERIYFDAINEAKKAVKMQDSKEIHRSMNTASKILKNLQIEKKSTQEAEKRSFKVGERVKYLSQKGVILNLSKESANVELDSGMKIKVFLKDLKKSGNEPQIKKASFKVESPKNVQVKLDLHGLRAEEALEKLDAFISDSLIAGFDEVLVYHGIGTGRLSSVVRDFLETHPKVLEFIDAPPQMGGFGAKIIKL